MTRAEACALLSVPDPFTEAELRKAYRRAALAAHPDRGGDEAKMKRVNAAHEVLSGKVGPAMFEVQARPRGRQRQAGAPARTHEEQKQELWVCRSCATVFVGGGLAATVCTVKLASGKVCGGTKFERWLGRY